LSDGTDLEAKRLLGSASCGHHPDKRALAMANGEAGNTQIVMLRLRNRSRAATGWNNDTVKLEHSGPEGGPVEVKAEHKIDIAALSHEHRDQLREILLAAKALGIKAV
jgi:hypothetical protein